jgi:hypothetical protein
LNIADHAWSADRMHFAITRGTTISDIVLIKGFR